MDLIAKYSRMSTDFALNGMTGDYDNNAYSVSAEVGWHLKLGEAAFIEPQAELTYASPSFAARPSHAVRAPEWKTA